MESNNNIQLDKKAILMRILDEDNSKLVGLPLKLFEKDGRFYFVLPQFKPKKNFRISKSVYGQLLKISEKIPVILLQYVITEQTAYACSIHDKNGISNGNSVELDKAFQKL